MHYNIIKTAAGARTRLRLPMLWHADAVAAEELPEAVFWVFIGGERVRVEKTPGSDDEYIFPELQAGQYAWDLVVDAQVVLHGVLKVRGSAVPPGGGEVCGTLLVDAPAMVLVLSPGPRGEVGPVGPQGLSAYEVALQHGYEGSADEWAEELSGAQAAATAAKEQATAAGNSAKAAADSATTASEKATAAGNSAKEAADSATTASEKAKAAGNSAAEAAGSATTASEKAKAAGNSAKEAADSATTASEKATAAASTLAAAAKLADNNTFSGVNTFNGSLVANGPVTLPGAATVNGISMQDLQGMQTALSSFLAGIGELSLETQLQPMRGCHAKTWDEWATLNPTWAQQETMIFYAPFAKADRANMASNANVSSVVKRSLWISPMPPDWDNSGGERISKAMGSNICLYCTKAGGIVSSLGNCYGIKKATVITPNATAYNGFLSNLGYITSKTGNEMHIFAPKLETITKISGNNSTFYYMPLLSAFSIYAPNLARGFYFSHNTNHADADGYALGQTCAVLQALIAGIGTPETVQTITTSTPQGTEEEIAALEAAAAAKNWQFNYVKLKK